MNILNVKDTYQTPILIEKKTLKSKCQINDTTTAMTTVVMITVVFIIAVMILLSSTIIFYSYRGHSFAGCGKY